MVKQSGVALEHEPVRAGYGYRRQAEVNPGFDALKIPVAIRRLVLGNLVVAE